MVPRNRPHVSLTFSPETLRCIDEQRGLINRSRYIEMVLMQFFADMKGERQ